MRQQKPQVVGKKRMNARRDYIAMRGHTVVVDASAHVRCELCGAYFWLDTAEEVPYCTKMQAERDRIAAVLRKGAK